MRVIVGDSSGKQTAKPIKPPCGTCARVRAAALALANKIANKTAIASRIRDVIRGK